LWAAALQPMYPQPWQKIPERLLLPCFILFSSVYTLPEPAAFAIPIDFLDTAPKMSQTL